MDILFSILLSLQTSFFSRYESEAALNAHVVLVEKAEQEKKIVFEELAEICLEKLAEFFAE